MKLQWHIYGGGIGAARGKYSYQAVTGRLNGRETFTIDPVSSARNVNHHLYYSVKYFGSFDASGWKELGKVRSPQEGKRLAQDYFNRALAASAAYHERGLEDRTMPISRTDAEFSASPIVAPRRNPSGSGVSNPINMQSETFSVGDFRPGMRVQLHPATDSWMRGDRYGVVKNVGRLNVRVHMDKSGRILRVHPRNIYEIIPERNPVRLNTKNAHALQARAFGRNPRRRVAVRRSRKRVSAPSQFGSLPILMQEERGGKWNTVAAFKGDARGVRRAKSYATRYASHERVAVRLIRR